jgi:hypothetical protein
MTVTGQIYDNQTNTGLPGASITMVTGQGTPVGGGTAADSNGIFSITSPQLDAGAQLLVSNVGYKSVMADPNVVVSTGLIGLDEQDAPLAAATVTATIKKKNYTPLLIGSAGLLLLAASSRKKRKARMGAVKVDWTDLAIKGGIAVGAYVFVVKPILNKLGVFNSPQTQATLDAQKKSLADAQAKQPGSYTADQYTGWANDIYNIGATNDTLSFTQQSQIVNDITQANNMTDLQLLISAFGVKAVSSGFWTTCQFLGFNCNQLDLPSFVKTVLDGQHLSNLNQYLSDQGINYQF